MYPEVTFRLPDQLTALPVTPFEFDPAAARHADEIRADGPAAIFEHLLRRPEDESGQLLALRLLHAFLPEPTSAPAPAPAPTDVLGTLAAVRAELADELHRIRTEQPDEWDAVLRERAPLALIGACWLDTVSQPATQPSVVVNRLFGQHHTLLGADNPCDNTPDRRRRALAEAGVDLPDVGAAGYLAATGARDLTALHGAFCLALARLPASFLPEVVGVHVARHVLGVDETLLGLPDPLPDKELRALLTEYLALCTAESRGRLYAAVELTVALEREHVALLGELARWRATRSLDVRVAENVRRHAPFAGRQHRNVRVGRYRLTDVFDGRDIELADFLTEFLGSPQVRARPDGDCRFLAAIRFGGPMFGIFDETEAATFRAWIEESRSNPAPTVTLPTDETGARATQTWMERIDDAEPDVLLRASDAADDRTLLHHMVHVEHHANVLPVAARRAARGLADAELLFEHGHRGRYTDASYFDYTPEALLARVTEIYWDRLVNPYRPLTEIPDRDDVIFGQKTTALASLIDGAWAYRIGNVGRFHRFGDRMLFAIYADEMGRGDLAKNHVTLIHQVLASMDVELPHIRDDAFLTQDELPDLYGFAVHQLCLALFPDSRYPEILGYNLGVEMFGLGELRMHEIQKLRHHHIDTAYEQAHLSIDNFSAGHARQAAEIIVGHLDEVARQADDAAVAAQWRRIWLGYASFAYFVEPALVRSVTESTEPSTEPSTELLI
jgi:hypothetical protein